MKNRGLLVIFFAFLALVLFSNYVYATAGDYLTANPNPCITTNPPQVTKYGASCATNISWGIWAPPRTSVQVWVNETPGTIGTLFACSTLWACDSSMDCWISGMSNGSEIADWIFPGINYTFNAYYGRGCEKVPPWTTDRTNLLATITVQGKNATTIPPVEPPAEETHYCLTQNDIMFSLYKKNESLVSNWDDVNAKYQICYDEIFKEKYSRGNPHDCNEGNTLLYKDSELNAHVSNASDSTYSFPICYGDLSCGLKTACSGNEKQVASVEGITNAHVAADDMYSYKLCCAIGGNSQYYAQWQDGSGNLKTNSSVNRTVNLYAKTALSSGTIVEMKIYENDGTSSEYIRTLNGTVSSDGVVKTSWKITDDDMNKASSSGEWDDEVAEFYFNVSNSGSDLMSGLLYTNKTFVPVPRPIANITFPSHRQIYFVNTPLLFSENSQGAFNLTWSIDDTLSELDSHKSSFQHIYTLRGQKTIGLRVYNEIGEWDEQQISILVVGSPGMLAYINKPTHFEKLGGSSFKNVDYSGEDSYVVDNTLNSDCTSGAVTCLAGDCPDFTMNAPIGCTTKNNVSISQTPQGFASLLFYWTFSDNTNVGGLNNFSGVKYMTPSSQLNDKWIRLVLSYNQGGINEVQTTYRNFTIFGRDSCVRDASKGTAYSVVFSDQGLVLREGYSTTPGICAGKDGLPKGENGNDDDCCPYGKICVAATGGARCIINSSAPSDCGGYKTKRTCELDEYSVSGTTSLNKNTCVRTEKECAWVDSECIQNESSYKVIDSTCNKNELDNPNLCSYGSCVTSFSDCINEKQTLTKKFTSSLSACDPLETQNAIKAGCTNQIISCGRPVYELPFFGISQMFGSLIAVALIYAIILFSNKRKND